MGTNVQKQNTIYGPLLHATSVHMGAEHGARRARNIENGGKWPKMRTLKVRVNSVHV